MSNEIPVKVNPYSLLISTDRLLPWEGNPSSRTSHKALKELDKLIEESGVITELAVVNCDNGTAIVADGHRRQQVGVNRSWDKLPCRVFPSSYDPEYLYVLLNGGTRAQSASDYLEAHVLSGALPRNQDTAGNIKYCVKLCGSPEETRRIMLEGPRRISPSVAKTVMNATSFYTGLSYKNTGKPTPVTDDHRQVFAWIVEHGEANLRELVRTPLITPGRKLQILKRAFKDNKPLKA
jgi:hypothetical protein